MLKDVVARVNRLPEEVSLPYVSGKGTVCPLVGPTKTEGPRFPAAVCVAIMVYCITVLVDFRTSWRNTCLRRRK
jgi:hypothetical protein